MTTSPDPTPPDRGLPRALPTAVLTAALVVLLALGTWLFLDRRPFDDADGTNGVDAALSASRRAALNFYGLDHRDADESLDRVLDLATGDFASKFASQRDAIRKNIVNREVVLSPTIVSDATAVEYVGDDEVWVLVAVDVATTVGTAAPDSSSRRARLKMTLVDGDWLVSDLEEVG